MKKRSPVSVDFLPAAGAAWRARWFHIIFGHEDAIGRRFDIVLIFAILASIVVTVLDQSSACICALAHGFCRWSGFSP